MTTQNQDKQLQEILDVMVEEGFLHPRLVQETVDNILSVKSNELWFSNGVVEFKMVHKAFQGGWLFHNFRRQSHSSLDRVKAVFPGNSDD